jgi:hypothetical protein
MEDNMKTKIFILCLTLFALLFSACSPAAAPTQSASKNGAGVVAPAAPAAPPAPAVAAAAPASESSAQLADSTINANAIRRIVIKNAVLSIVVKDPVSAVDAIGKLAEKHGGFIVNSNTQKVQTGNGLETPQATIDIRVPAEFLTQSLDEIKALVSDQAAGILNEQVTGSDVTKEYTDLKSRLTNLQNAADQLKTIMAEAHKTEDVMSVYNQLTQVNEQIEVLKGQIKYYDESSSMSEIKVDLRSEASIKPISVAGWQPAGIARDALQALVNTLQVLASLAIWFALYFLPILLILALVILVMVLIIKAFSKAFKKPAKPQGPPAA